MTGWLLDTNVVSELRRPLPEVRVARFFREKPLALLHISVVTIAEIRYGIAVEPDPLRRATFSEWLAHRIRPMFAERVLGVTEEVILQWRLIVQAGRRSGHTYPQPDLFIAATAFCHGLTVVTRDARPFARAGVPVLNPWTDTW